MRIGTLRIFMVTAIALLLSIWIINHSFGQTALKTVFIMKRLFLSIKKSAYTTIMFMVMILGFAQFGWGQTYKSQFISMDIGSTTWGIGETRNVKVTVKNIGTATWTDGSPDVNIGIKWNAWSDYHVRLDANGLASGNQREYTLTITAPCSLQTENLTFDVVKEGDCWFGNNNGSCGPGNTVYKSALITITNPPGGNPADFGNGVWNVYGYNGGNLDLTGAYYGYYTESNLSYNTLNRWGTLGSPSDASGWQGCYVPVDNHVVVSKRRSFPSGCYQLDMPNHDDDVRVYINGNLVWSAVCCSAATNIWQGYLTSSSTIEVRHLEYSGGSNQSLTLTVLSVGDPSVFGNGIWNVYGYNGGNLDLSGTYYGYYTESNLSYNTLNRWCTTCSPSDASGWQGCIIPVDNHVVVSKRTNFTCGYYQLDMPNHDDDVRLYINGNLVWSHEPGCCDAHTNIWTGYLTSSSTVEVRHLEVSGGSNQSLTITPVGTSISTAPTSISGTTSICTGGSTTLSVVGGSLAIGASWKWYSGNCGSPGLAIGTGPSISVSPTEPTTYFVRAEGTCNTTSCASQLVTVVDDPSLSAATRTNAVICAGGSSVFSSTLSNGTGTVGYQWQYSTDNSNWNSVAAGTPTGATYANPATASMAIGGITAAGTYYYRLSATSTGNGCSTPVYSASATLQVVADPFAPIATKSPGATAVCTGTSLTLINPTQGSGGTGTCNIEYATSTDGGVSYSAFSTTVPTITATGTDNRIKIHTNCNGPGCDISPEVVYTWTVNALPTFTTSVIANISCYGGNDGSISVSITGGVNNSPYYYSINNGADYYPYLLSGTYPAYTITGLSAITYKFRIKDKNGCESAYCVN